MLQLDQPESLQMWSHDFCCLKVVSELSSNIGTVEGLERFQYKDKNNKDWGLNVRQRAKELRSLVTNPELIRRERQKVLP